MWLQNTVVTIEECYWFKNVTESDYRVVFRQFSVSPKIFYFIILLLIYLTVRFSSNRAARSIVTQILKVLSNVIYEICIEWGHKATFSNDSSDYSAGWRASQFKFLIIVCEIKGMMEFMGVGTRQTWVQCPAFPCFLLLALLRQHLTRGTPCAQYWEEILMCLLLPLFLSWTLNSRLLLQTVFWTFWFPE